MTCIANDIHILREFSGSGFAATIVQWEWPEVVDYSNRQERLEIEMSLPPYSSVGTACFPEIEASDYCPMGSIFLRYPGQLVRGRGPGGRIRVLRWTFTAAVADRLLGKLPVPCLTTLQRLLDISSAPLRAMLDLALRELRVERRANEAALHALNTVIAAEVARILDGCQDMRVTGAVLPDWRFRRIREMLAERGSGASLDDLANACGLSARHLNRQFARLTGSSVAAYARRVSIEHAKDLLMNESLSIAQIAKAAKFSSISAFSRAFRQMEGMTPSEFRWRSTLRG